MKKYYPYSGNRSCNNEDGFVLVVGMMIMLVLTVIGFAATRTAIFEVQISGHDKISKKIFYNAEAAAYEGAQRLENENDPDNLKAERTALKWLFTLGARNSLLNDSTKWQENGLVSGMTDNSSSVDIAGLDYGVIKGEKGSSLKMTSSSVYGFQLLGHSTLANGKKIIEIGYKKRY